ncbi:HAMP domain-containing sensor histidine kinase [Fusobacterium sp.]|jgi:two-component system sensor histidine kinase VanS|uniref:sensor histidine kinase n=1 Tax=Fusobacterium sp. TaxID=68766 RepID=UPI001D7E3A8F|nr:HAMP domain-containing sensor histidine kinase [Fusobacterium sp.]MBS5789270.1 HAMP domain-containing histidine kinase [Fusobacterium sp.]
MKKIFYKIFFTLIIITYIPLILLYSFHSFYMKSYIERKKIAELDKIVHMIDENKIASEIQNELKKNKDIKLEIIDGKEDKHRLELFNYLNKRFWKIDFEKMAINSVEVRFEKSTNFLNKIYVIKKIGDNKYAVISSLMVIPEIIYKIILSSYIYVTPFLLILMLILSYFISKKMAVPIEVLEDISTRVLNLDFSKSIDFKGNNELTILGNNITTMAENLKKNNDELKILNEKLKYELDKNQKFMKFEKEFINSVSHELKTPIAIINGYIEVLQDKIIDDQEGIEKIYSIMYKEGTYLDKMIKDLNSYHSYEHEFFNLKRDKFIFNKFFQKILSKYLLDIEEKNITLKIDIEDAELEGDLKKLDVVINNLLTNAITYIDNRGIINITLKNNIFIIENSSEPISKDNLENIFKPFYKLDFSRKRKYGGTGLGLAIVKNILDFLHILYKVDYDEERGFFVFQIEFK